MVVGAAVLKTAHCRRRIPLAKELLRQLRLHRLRAQGEFVFPGPKGEPIDYHNSRARVGAPDEETGRRRHVSHTAALLRHRADSVRRQCESRADSRAPSLGEFHARSVADAVPEQLEEAGVLLKASGSILVAAPKQGDVRTAQVLEIESAPGEIRTPDPQVRSLMLYPTELRARSANSTTADPEPLGRLPGTFAA
jgi:hypothetical protein